MKVLGTNNLMAPSFLDVDYDNSAAKEIIVAGSRAETLMHVMAVKWWGDAAAVDLTVTKYTNLTV